MNSPYLNKVITLHYMLKGKRNPDKWETNICEMQNLVHKVILRATLHLASYITTELLLAFLFIEAKN